VPCGRTEWMAVPRHPDGGNRRQTGSFLGLFHPLLGYLGVVVVDVAYPVTQRGNGGQFILATDSERGVYLDLLGRAVKLRGVAVVGAADWSWSSAAAHCGTAQPQAWLERVTWRQPWCEACWQEFLGAGETESELRAIRPCTHTGRPLGTREFVEKLERHTQRRLAPQKGGRKPNSKTKQEEGTLQN
jgi:hypothetical protein